jgi:hypothetical protein
MNFAVIENNIVKNIIVCDSKQVAEQVTGLLCIQYTDTKLARIGDTWDGSNFTTPTEDN